MRAERLGEAEVEHLRHDAARVTLKEDVLRLQVAMDEALAVGGAERRADAAQDRAAPPVALIGDAEARRCRSVFALEQFHDQERPPVCGRRRSRRRGRREDGQSRRPRALPVGSGEPRSSGAGDILPDQLHRHRTFEHVVDRRVDRAHAAAAEPALQPVAAVEQARTACVVSG